MWRWAMTVRRALAHPVELLGASMPMLSLVTVAAAFVDHRLDDQTMVGLSAVLSAHPLLGVAAGLIDPHPDRVARWFLRPMRLFGLMVVGTLAYAWWAGR